MTTTKRRISKTIPQVVSEQRAISAMERYAGATSQLKQIEAQIELATQRAREDHQERIEECQRLQKEAQEALQVLRHEDETDILSGQKDLSLAAWHHRFSNRYATGGEETINHLGDRIASVQAQGMAFCERQGRGG